MKTIREELGILSLELANLTHDKVIHPSLDYKQGYMDFKCWVKLKINDILDIEGEKELIIKSILDIDFHQEIVVTMWNPEKTPSPNEINDAIRNLIKECLGVKQKQKEVKS